MSDFPVIAGLKIFIILDVVISWIAVGGNALIIWALLSPKNKKKKDTTVFIICGQATADLLAGLCSGSFGIASLSNDRFPGRGNFSNGTGFFRGETIWRGRFCTLNGFLLHLISFASIYTILLIAWERYCAIVRPLKARISLQILLMHFTIIWVVGIFFASVPIFTHEYVLQTPGAFCYGLIGPNVASTITCIAILFASSCIVILYSRMSKHVIDAFKGRLQGKEGAISKQFITIILCFMICWLPAGSDFFLGMIGNEVVKSKLFVQFLRPLSYLLCTGNSAVNPLLYIFMNKMVKRVVFHQVKGLSFPTFRKYHKRKIRKGRNVIIYCQPRSKLILK